MALLAWIGLVPLLLVIEGKRLKCGFLLSSVWGYIFFAGIFHWILEVPNYTLLHHSILGLYLGSYIGLFGLLFSLLSRCRGFTTSLFAAPFVWITLEYVRSNLFFMALPWGLLAHTQYNNPLVVQVSAITGSSGVSFLIVTVNCALAAVIRPLFQRFIMRERAGYKSFVTRPRAAFITVAVFLTLATALYGHVTVSRSDRAARKGVKVSVVQGDIEQAKKWDPRHAEYIIRTYADLTRKTFMDKPDLIVWPESATPQPIDRDLGLYRTIMSVVGGQGAYLLLGSSDRQKFKKGGPTGAKLKNSAFLVDPETGISRDQRYDKMRLLPFGEYLPYAKTISWQHINIPDVDHYIPGNEFTVFELPACRFGVTICWENIFPDLVRQFVKRGAQFIVNITNEAWFGQTAAPYQFVAMNVFRAVENRVFVIRCANTGVSCFIDPCGRITNRVKDENGKDIFITGIATEQVVPMESKTFYTQHGDWLAKVSAVCSVVFLVIALLRKGERKY